MQRELTRDVSGTVVCGCVGGNPSYSSVSIFLYILSYTAEHNVYIKLRGVVYLKGLVMKLVWGRGRVGHGGGCV